MGIMDRLKRKPAKTSTVFMPAVGHLKAEHLASVPIPTLKKAIQIAKRQLKEAEKQRKELEAKAKPLKEKIQKFEEQRIQIVREIRKSPTNRLDLVEQLDTCLDKINQHSKKLASLGLSPPYLYDRPPNNLIGQLQFVNDIRKGKIFRGEL